MIWISCGLNMFSGKGALHNKDISLQRELKWSHLLGYLEGNSAFCIIFQMVWEVRLLRGHTATWCFEVSTCILRTEQKYGASLEAFNVAICLTRESDVFVVVSFCLSNWFSAIARMFLLFRSGLAMCGCWTQICLYRVVVAAVQWYSKLFFIVLCYWRLLEAWTVVPTCLGFRTNQNDFHVM